MIRFFLFVFLFGISVHSLFAQKTVLATDSAFIIQSYKSEEEGINAAKEITISLPNRTLQLDIPKASNGLIYGLNEVWEHYCAYADCKRILTEAPMISSAIPLHNKQYLLFGNSEYNSPHVSAQQLWLFSLKKEKILLKIAYLSKEKQAVILFDATHNQLLLINHHSSDIADNGVFIIDGRNPVRDGITKQVMDTTLQKKILTGIEQKSMVLIHYNFEAQTHGSDSLQETVVGKEVYFIPLH